MSNKKPLNVVEAQEALMAGKKLYMDDFDDGVYMFRQKDGSLCLRRRDVNVYFFDNIPDRDNPFVESNINRNWYICEELVVKEISPVEAVKKARDIIQQATAEATAEKDKEIERLKEALKPFTHSDLSKILGGNNLGCESIVFQRDNAILKIKDFVNAQKALAGEEE